MARAFGNLCRELYGSHLFIKGKLVIDTDCNVQGINAMTVANLCISNDFIIKGNADVGNLVVPQLTGNIVSDKIITSNICESQVDNGIKVVGNMHTHGNSTVCGEMAVDLIVEKTMTNKVCIGKELGQTIVACTFSDATEPQTAVGDSVWQSFEIQDVLFLSKINIEMERTDDFIGDAIQCRIFNGVSTHLVDLLGSIQVNSYNGGDIDFSSLGLVLTPGAYTVQMDYPYSQPLNPINYIWYGHTRIEWEPQEPPSSVSNTTLHLTIYTLDNGGIKVGPYRTCVFDFLKLEFPDANCDMQIVNLDPENGRQPYLQSNGFIDIITNCDGNIDDRTLSFDDQFDFSNMNTFDNVCANIIRTDEFSSKSNAMTITINSNIYINDTIVVGGCVCANILQTDFINSKGNTGNGNVSIIEINGNNEINIISNVFNQLVNNVFIDGNVVINANATVGGDVCVIGNVVTNTITEKTNGQGIDICGNFSIKNTLFPNCIFNNHTVKLCLNTRNTSAPLNTVYVADGSPNERVQLFDTSGNYIAQFGSSGNANVEFDMIQYVAVGYQGVYITDQNNHRVQKLTVDGTIIDLWGGLGLANGQFNTPKGITIDLQDNVYVADSLNNRIQKFDQDGFFINKWGTVGSGNSQFDNPYGVAVDQTGNIYVADSANNRIQKFNNSATYLLEWGTLGVGDGQFDFPVSVQVDDNNGRIYVVDSANHRVEKFDLNGNFLLKWGTNGTADGEFDNPLDVVVDLTGNVYITDQGNERIQKFDSNGNFLLKWGTAGIGNGEFASTVGIAIDFYGPRNRILENTFTSVFWDAVKYDTDNMFPEKSDTININKAGVYSITSQIHWLALPIAEFPTFKNDNQSPNGIAVNSLGEIYVSDTGNDRVIKLAPDGRVILKWGTNGSGNGQFMSPMGIGIDSFGDVYVADLNNARIQKFDPNGNFILKWGSVGNAVGEFTNPYDIAVDTIDNIYVTDMGNNRIQKFSLIGTPILQWGTAGNGNSQFNQPRCIAHDATSSRILVTDTLNYRVQIFDYNGIYQTEFGSLGIGNGQFQSPFGVEFLWPHIYVSDIILNTVQKFNQNGVYISQWGSTGNGIGQFDGINQLGIDSLSNVYTNESINTRVQKFDINGAPIAKWGFGQPNINAIPLVKFIYSIQVSSNQGANWTECARDVKQISPPVITARAPIGENPRKLTFTFDEINFNVPTLGNTVPQNISCKCEIPADSLVRSVAMCDLGGGGGGVRYRSLVSPYSRIQIGTTSPSQESHITVRYCHDIPS